MSNYTYVASKILRIISNNVKIVNNPNFNHETEAGAYSSGDIVFIIFSSCLVWLMIPGVGFFYSGLLQVENALYVIFLTFWSVSIVWIQWFLFGYSLCFSKSGSFFIGNFHHIFLMDTGIRPSLESNLIPDLLFCFYQGMFGTIAAVIKPSLHWILMNRFFFVEYVLQTIFIGIYCTVFFFFKLCSSVLALVVGSVADRIRFLPTTLFIFSWTTLIYDFIVYWTWNPNGWVSAMGGLDFAGGTPIHVSSGSAGLALCILMGTRTLRDNKPHNMTYVFLGTMILWFGWFGFNAGSALSPSFQSINACIVTNLSASIGGFTWVVLAYIDERKFSPLGFCSGAIAGLVAITPGCGYVSPTSSLVFGSLGSLICFIATKLMHKSPVDDSVDLFAIHGVGGIVGSILTGIFAEKAYAPGIEGGCMDGHCIQIVYQLIDCFAGFAWSFVLTFAIVLILSSIPGLKLKEPETVEGIDLSQMGTPAYEYLEVLKKSFKYQIKFSSLWYGMRYKHTNDDPFVIGYYHKFGEASSFDFSTQLEMFCKGIRKMNVNGLNPQIIATENRPCNCEIKLY